MIEDCFNVNCSACSSVISPCKFSFVVVDQNLFYFMKKSERFNEMLLYHCRCPSYTNLPTSCRLITDPNDACCLVPDCNTFTPAPTPNPSIYNPGTGPSVTGINNPSTTPKPLIVMPTYVPAVFSGSSSNNPSGGTGNSVSGNNSKLLMSY